MRLSMRTNKRPSERPTKEQRLNELYDFVGRELRSREDAGDLTRAELTPSDIVDTVMIRAYRERLERASEDQIADRLQELARRQIEAEVDRLRSERARSVHIEKDIP